MARAKNKNNDTTAEQQGVQQENVIEQDVQAQDNPAPESQVQENLEGQADVAQEQEVADDNTTSDKNKKTKTAAAKANQKMAEDGQETEAEPRLSDAVAKILKCFKQYEWLYVDNHGGVYTKDSKPCVRRNAVLYKNPYYES